MEPAAAIGWFGLCALSGLAAAVVMDYPMSRQQEGFTPAYIAAGVLTRRPPAAVTRRAALVAHHAAGVLGGILHGLAAFTLAAALPGPLAPALAVGGIPLLAHVPAVTAVVVFVYLLFAHLVLPRAGGPAAAERATAVRGQWLRSALVYGAALTLAVPAIALAVG